MSESDQQDKSNNLQNESETRNEKSATGRKYPFQTTRSSNNNSSAKTKLENVENIADHKQSEIKIETEMLTQVINKEKKLLDENIPAEMVNQMRFKINSSESKDDKTSLEQAAANPRETKTELDLVEVADKSDDRKKIRRQDLTENELNEICGDRDGKSNWRSFTKMKTPGLDPRFQQQNQTLRCFVMYTDFYRCENILGEGELACQWFKDVFTSICPLDWIRRWDEAREEGRFGWTKGRSQGKFPGDRYGV